MRTQYRGLQLPTKGTGAFMPVPARQRQSNSAGQNQAAIVGSPGTVPVASPRPAAMNDFGLGGAMNQPSSCAPDYFYPSKYYYRIVRAMKFPGRVLQSDNPLPVPAGVQGRTGVQWQHRVRVGGRTTTASVRPFTQWPTYGGR